MSVDDHRGTRGIVAAVRRYRRSRSSCPGCVRCVRRRAHDALDGTGPGAHAPPDVHGTSGPEAVPGVARSGVNGLAAVAMVVLHALTLGLLQARIDRCPTCSHPAFQHGRRRRTRPTPVTASGPPVPLARASGD